MSGFSRKLDLSKFGGDSSDDDSPPAPNPKHALGAEKQQTFSHGIQRKSKRDLEREQAKRKQDEEEREAARVFAEFTADFEGESSAAASRKPGGGFVRAGNSKDAYVPSKPPADRGPRAFRDTSPPPASAPAKPKGKRQMDSFLEDLKRDQAAREERFKRSGGVGGSVSVHAAWERERGSHDMGDSMTTNLYVNNLPEGAKEPALGMLFAKFGPIGSVKIFWPRFDEPPPGADVNALQSRRVGPKSGLTGFVAFMRREDAERALREFDGLDWGGSVLKVSWSKAIKLPGRPIYVHPSHSGQPRRERSRSPPGRHGRSPPPHLHQPTYNPRGGRPSRSPSPSSSRIHPPPEPLAAGIDPEMVRAIRAVAERVKTVGGAFEANLRAREGTEGKWRFLHPDADTPECHFYRQLVDPHYRLPPPPPKPFVDEGYDSTYSTDASEASEDDRLPKGKLGKLARRRFVSCLRGMRGERGSIARVMAMALKHADAADEIADVIVQSLIIFETPVPIKLARLHLISDILSNSACPLPSAWKYRDVFEARLAIVFDHLGELYQSFKAQAGRLSAETFRGQVAAVLDVLDVWIVFNPALIQELRLRLAGHKPRELSDSPAPLLSGASVGGQLPPAPSATEPAPSRFIKSAFASTFTAAPVADVAAEDLDGAPLGGEDDDVDGAPMDENLDGEAMPEEDLDGEAIPEEDLDGEAMAPEEDLDGEAMEGDLDGEAM